jgi:hypothetical protein
MKDVQAFHKAKRIVRVLLSNPPNGVTTEEKHDIAVAILTPPYFTPAVEGHPYYYSATLSAQQQCTSLTMVTI